jgi:cell wall-associated NlpC family hydrolase
VRAPRRPRLLALAVLAGGGALTGGVALATGDEPPPAPAPVRAAEPAPRPAPPPAPTSRAQIVEPAAGGAPATDARDQVPDALEEAIAASAGQAGADPGESMDMPEGGGSSLRRADVLEGGIAIPPLDAPSEVRAIIEAGNMIARTPYKWGGGHGKWQDTGYDCSGSVSYALSAAGLVDSSAPSGAYMKFGEPGRGKWVTIYANAGHMFIEVAGVRFDTSGAKRSGSRWQSDTRRPASGYAVRHPPGL